MGQNLINNFLPLISQLKTWKNYSTKHSSTTTIHSTIVQKLTHLSVICVVQEVIIHVNAWRSKTYINQSTYKTRKKKRITIKISKEVVDTKNNFLASNGI